MKKTGRWMGLLAGVAMLGGIAMLGSCTGTADSSTFACTSSTGSSQCIETTQYCEQASDGTTVTRATCRAVPANCGSSPCSGCLASGQAGIIGCSSISVGGSRSTVVTVRQ